MECADLSALCPVATCRGLGLLESSQRRRCQAAADQSADRSAHSKELTALSEVPSVCCWLSINSFHQARQTEVCRTTWPHDPAKKVFTYGGEDVHQHLFLIHHGCAVPAMRGQVKYVTRRSNALSTFDEETHAATHDDRHLLMRMFVLRSNQKGRKTKRQIIKPSPTTICLSIPSAMCSIGMPDQFRCRAPPLIVAPAFISSSLGEVVDMRLFSSRCFQTRSSGGVLGLYIDHAVLAVFAFAHRGHHP